jgi:hypothetical protein
LLKAEPLNAILDPQYFVRQVHECVVKVLSDRMAKEQQAADQAAPFRCLTLNQPQMMFACISWFANLAAVLSIMLFVLDY